MPSRTKTLTLIAALSAANVAFRFALAGGPPNVKPTAFLVIVAGIIGGPISGFAVGWLSMTVSDLAAFGAGIWTIETSGGMAIVGLLAGFIWHRVALLNRWKMAIGGFLLTVVYDVGTSIVDALLFSYPVRSAILGLYVPFLAGSVSPYPFGLMHEFTTAILLGTVGPSLIAQIRRVYR
jgi:energy-coupling factor transport system substrate-specific component